MPDATLIPRRFINITPSDTVNNIGAGCIGVLCGATGSIRAKGSNNKEGTFADIPVQAGQVVPGEFDRIYSTGTSAALVAANQLVALYAQ